MRHAGVEESLDLDQSAASGWTSIGTYAFAAGGDQSLRLDDNTGEPNDAMIQLVFDAVRLTPVGEEGDDVGAEGEGGTGEGDSGMIGADAGADESGDDAGCGCSARSTDRDHGWLSILVLGVLGAGRRRRRARRAPTGC